MMNFKNYYIVVIVLILMSCSKDDISKEEINEFDCTSVNDINSNFFVGDILPDPINLKGAVSDLDGRTWPLVNDTIVIPFFFITENIGPEGQLYRAGFRDYEVEYYRKIFREFENIINQDWGYTLILKEYETLKMARLYHDDILRVQKFFIAQSHLGRVGGVQTLNLLPVHPESEILDQIRTSVLHELLHCSTASIHEHMRGDRDQYIIVHNQNIIDGVEKQFASYESSYYTKYDLQSIMHYDSYAYSRNEKPTLTTLDNETFEQPKNLSQDDINTFHWLYECSESFKKGF